MNQKYAANTTVSPDRSKQEIETLLKRYGADQFIYAWKEQMAVIGFRMNGYQVRISLPLPDPTDYSRTPAKGQKRTELAATKAHDQAIRQAWRALVLVIKAKLEATDAGITTLEEQFLADIVMPDNTTVADNVIPGLRTFVESGNLPPMLSTPQN